MSNQVVAGHLTAFNEERARAGVQSSWRADATETRVFLQQQPDGELLVSAPDLDAPTPTVYISPPPGEELHAGLYTGAQRSSFRDPGRPGIDLTGAGGCEVESGRFDVKQISRDSAGIVKRLWVNYELRCGQYGEAVFGELLVDTRAGSASPLTSPVHVWWPDANAGQPGLAVPVAFHNRGATPLSAGPASIGGRNRADFSIVQDGCAGQILATGTHCDVVVRFTAAAGPRVANVGVSLGGQTVKAALDGFGVPGRTEVRLVSDPGDPVGEGGTYTYTPANAVITTSGGAAAVAVQVLVGSAEEWTGQFAPPLGQPMAIGFYPNAKRFPPSDTQPGLRVVRSVSCTLQGFFNVSSYGTAPDGTVTHFGVTFEQHCNGGEPALRGEMLWRVPEGDVTPPAPVTGFQATRSGRLLNMSWSRPFDSDYAATLVRYLYGTVPPGGPNSGRLAYAGKPTSASMAVSQNAVAIAAYAVDTSGNVSPPVTVAVPPG